MTKHLVALVVAVAALAALPACTDDGGELIVYSGRNQNLIGPLLEEFAAETGIDIRVKYGDTSELLPTLLEEGDRTRVDVFVSQDAGALAQLDRQEMLAPLPEALVGDVDPRFRASNRTWVGLSGRARVIAYNTGAVDPADLPRSVFEVTEPAWKGRVGFPPTNASFIAFVSALREEHGDARTRAFLEGLAANDAKRFDNNVLTLDAVASGDVDLGLVNHYYLFNEFKERGDVPVANHYPGQQPDGEGTFVNVAGAAVLDRSDQRDDAVKLVEFLLSRRAQEYFRAETSEYPLAAGVEPLDVLPPLAALRTIDVPLERLGRDLETTVEMIKDAGLS